MLTRSFCAGALAAALAGCGSGDNDAMQHYGGIDGTTAPATTAPTQPGAGTSGGTPQAPAAGEPYVVLKGGETIYAIARKMLGSEARWKELYEANRGVVSDPDRVAAGTKLYPPTKRTTAKKFRGLTDGLD
ncbi:MAG: LysM peptidoglycan-binding domain-containing protein [Planctomycetota bacterium]|jgi:nucleoid-associated protein YgaU